MAEPRQASLWEMSDLATPWSIHVIATLDIPRHIESGLGRLDDLAIAVSCDRYMLGCVMRLLVSKGFFIESEPDVFALNDAVRPLLEPGAQLGLNLDRFGGRMAHAWGTLLELVRTGETAYSDRFGMTFWEDLDTHPAVKEDFDNLIGPGGHGTPSANVLPNGDWAGIRSVVDVGGGTGALLIEILRAHPDVTGVLVDVPLTAERAAAAFQDAGIAHRATATGQSFFESLPSGADLYILKSILNDWPDRETREILSRCADASRPGGKIAVIGGVTQDDRPAKLSIEMVLLGGKSRTLTEFSALIAEFGLKVEQTGTTDRGNFVVVCNHAPGSRTRRPLGEKVRLRANAGISAKHRRGPVDRA